MNFENVKKFISYPLLRLSNQSCLNDPFEFKLTSYSESKIDEFLGDTKNISEIDRYFWSHGVISLTESRDNLLM